MVVQQLAEFCIDCPALTVVQDDRSMRADASELQRHCAEHRLCNVISSPCCARVQTQHGRFEGPGEALSKARANQCIVVLRGSAMFVIKRDGRKEPVHFDKITARITKLSYGLNPDFCDPVSIPGRPPRFKSASAAAALRQGTRRCCVARLRRRPPAQRAPQANSNAGSAADAAPCCVQVLVAQKVTMGVYKGVTTSELDELAAETAASLTATHPDYALVRTASHPPPRFPPGSPS